MIVAGIGCRRSCPPGDILALLQQAGAVDAIAAPAWKRHEAGLLAAAAVAALPLWLAEEAALQAVQPLCVTRSELVARAVGVASVAEAAALAWGGRLVRARWRFGMATCALAETPG